MNIPAGHQQVMPYLILDNAADFEKFTSTVFNAVPLSRHLRDEEETIMHAEIAIGSCTIMYAQAFGQWTVQTANLFIYVDNADASLEKALQNRATLVMELSDRDYGRTCGVKDPFGNTWWITSI
jgi:PhnB protein